MKAKWLVFCLCFGLVALAVRVAVQATWGGPARAAAGQLEADTTAPPARLVAPIRGSKRPKAIPFNAPVRLAKAGSRRIYLTDSEQRRVLRLEGQHLRAVHAFNVSGVPLGIAWFDGKLYVGSETYHRVDVYDEEGNWLHHLGSPVATFGKPTDIAIDSSGTRAYVVDGEEKVVKVFELESETGSQIGTIPSGGPSESLLANPTGIALDEVRGEVLVSDFGNPLAWVYARVQVFDYAGNLLQTISGREGMMGNRFSRPQGLAVDGEGHIFLVESLLGTVFVLDRVSGATLATIGEYGFAEGQLALPLDVMFDGRQQALYVTNHLHGSVEVLSTRRVIP